MLVGCYGYFKMAAEFYEVGGGRDAGRRQEDVTQRSTTGTDGTKPCMTVAERLRQYRERQEQVQRRGIETLKEMDARAEEYRRKQEEDRRRTIRIARTKEEEQRASVEERRRRLLEEEHERRLLKLQKMWEINRRTGETNRRKRKKSAAWRLGMGSGAMSDGTLSSGGRTPTRPNRPHSIAGQLPNYALPTVASQIRSARRTSDGFDGEVVAVCYRCRSASPAARRRSRSAEPTVRSGHTIFKMAATADLPQTSNFARGTSSRSMPPLGGAGSVPAPTPSAVPLPSRSSRLRTRLTSMVTGSKPDDRKAEAEANAKTEGEREWVERKRKSFPWLNRKNRATKRPQEPSSEFRLFSFRHQDGTASMTVTRGLKTSGKSKLETFQQSRQVKPVQNNDVKGVARKVCRESEGHPTETQPLRQHNRPARPRPPSTKNDDVSSIVAKDKSRITMETDLDTLETRPVLRRSDAGRASAKRREVSMETPQTTTLPAAIRPNKIPVAKLDEDAPDSASKSLNRKESRSSENPDDMETVDGARADLWTDDGGNSETISDGTSLEQFFEDSTSLSETAEDLDPVRKSVGLRRDIPQYLFPTGVPLAQRDEDGLLEDEDAEETVEIYEELQIFEEVEVKRNDATELTLTLEKIVTEETLEIMYPSPEDTVLHGTGRGSVSSV